MNKILESIYYNPKNNASFSSVNALYKSAKLIDKNIKLKDVKNWLSGELTYTLHKPVRKNFSRNRIVVSSINQQWEADLVDLQEFSKWNNGKKFLLTVIDCFSKYAFVRVLKDKSDPQVIKAFRSIFKERVCAKLRTDKGKEFCNKFFKKFLEKSKVDHFTSNDNKIKCAIIERFNRTLKSRMFKYFT